MWFQCFIGNKITFKWFLFCFWFCRVVFSISWYLILYLKKKKKKSNEESVFFVFESIRCVFSIFISFYRCKDKIILFTLFRQGCISIVDDVVRYTQRFLTTNIFKTEVKFNLNSNYVRAHRHHRTHSQTTIIINWAQRSRQNNIAVYFLQFFPFKTQKSSTLSNRLTMLGDTIHPSAVT